MNRKVLENENGECLLTCIYLKKWHVGFWGVRMLYNRICKPKTSCIRGVFLLDFGCKLTNTNMKNLHKEFVRLGRERNKITYKLLA
ncbi:MAG: hypothetical protein V1679_00750, partial [Candidatus Peregrinibacteria bacterium]